MTAALIGRFAALINSTADRALPSVAVVMVCRQCRRVAGAELLTERSDGMRTALGRVAADVGVGLAAGLAGTAAITASTMLESKLRGREESQMPAEAAQKVLGVKPTDEQSKARFSTLVHWAYGTGWGTARGLLDAFGLPPVAATAAHAALLWGTEQAMLPAMKLSPPPTEQSAEELAVDGAHHLLYAVTTGVTYSLLSRSA